MASGLLIELDRTKLLKSEDILNRESEKIIDLRGILEPIAFLKVSQICRDMKAEDIIELCIEDSDSHASLLRLLKYFGVLILEDKKSSDENIGWHIVIQKQVEKNINL